MLKVDNHVGSMLQVNLSQAQDSTTGFATDSQEPIILHVDDGENLRERICLKSGQYEMQFAVVGNVSTTFADSQQAVPSMRRVEQPMEGWAICDNGQNISSLASDSVSCTSAQDTTFDMDSMRRLATPVVATAVDLTGASESLQDDVCDGQQWGAGNPSAFSSS